jgi:hypothetical protein
MYFLGEKDNSTVQLSSMIIYLSAGLTSHTTVNMKPTQMAVQECCESESRSVGTMYWDTC